MACQSWQKLSMSVQSARNLIAILEGFIIHGHTWMGAYLIGILVQVALERFLMQIHLTLPASHDIVYSRVACAAPSP